MEARLSRPRFKVKKIKNMKTPMQILLDFIINEDVSHSSIKEKIEDWGLAAEREAMTGFVGKVTGDFEMRQAAEHVFEETYPEFKNKG